MGLLRAYKEKRQSKKIARLVKDYIAKPVPRPSQIADYAAELPRSIKRAHKLEVRRQYRNRLGVMPSNQRQILAESVAAQLFAEAEHERERQARYRAEDERYNVSSLDRAPAPVKDRPGRSRVRRSDRKRVWGGR